MASKKLLKSIGKIKKSVKSLSDPSKGKGLKQSKAMAKKNLKKKY